MSIAAVLDLAGYLACVRVGDQLRGPCPIHRSGTQRSRSFSVNLVRNIYRCFVCGSSGNQLDLWMKLTRNP
jgi:DNA primase